MHMDRELRLSEPFVAFLKAQAGKMGPLGPSLHRRSYARMIDTSEGRVPEKSWSETARRVARGNVCFVDEWAPSALESEESTLRLLLDALILVPAGRHLRQTGAPEGVQFINNCHVSGFSEADPAHHFVFLFNGLMQGGGVGANYSNRFLSRLPVQQSDPTVFYYLDPLHPDYLDIRTAFAEDEIAGRAEGQWIERIDGAYTRYVRVKDSREGWAEALRVLLETHWSPIGDTILFNFSDVRPKGSEIKRFGGTASGPKYLIEMLDRVKSVLVQRPLMQRISSLQAMEIDHAIARCVISGNVRRSARMSIKYWLDEDIFDFIVCKDDEMSHWSTNISIEVDDDFFLALNDPENASHEWAQNVLLTAAEHGLAHGEPGFWNSSLSQIGEPEEVIATNPCGEEVMAAYEACCLAHLNLYRLFLYEGADRDRMIEVCWRYLTRYLLRATEGDTVDEVERAVVDRKRRLGAGFFGFAGMLALLGIPYATCYTYDRVREYLRKWYAVVREEATAYANELNIPSPVKVTTLAPTGTTAKLTESPPSAQALIAREFVLRVRHAKDDPQVQEALEQGLDVEDCIYAPNTAVVCRYMRDPLIEHLYSLGWSEEKVESLVTSQDEIPLGQSLQIQAFLQEHWADNAISFTHMLYPGKNLPSTEEYIRLLKEALPRLKGTTVMCDAGRPQSPYTKITREEYEARDHRHSVGQAIEDCLNGVCGI